MGTPEIEQRRALWRSLPSDTEKHSRTGDWIANQEVMFRMISTPFGEVRIGRFTVSGGVRAGGHMVCAAISIDGDPWRRLGRTASWIIPAQEAAEWASVCTTLEDLNELDIGPVVDEINTQDPTVQS